MNKNEPLAKTLLSAALLKQKEAQQPQVQIKLIPFEELKPGTEPEYLIGGIFPRGGLVVVWGPPKCGKSFWTMDAVLHVALNWEYRGRPVHGGAVVYCAFEGQSGYGKRAEAFRIKKLPKHKTKVPFYLVAVPMNFGAQHAELIEAIRATLGNTKPVVVVLDTLNRSLGGSESKDEDMTTYIRAADAVREAFGCAVIIVHHCGVDASRPRGHTSLTGAVDAQIAVARDPVKNIIATVEWMKDGEDGATIVSRLEVVEVVAADEDGAPPTTSCVVIPAEDTAPARAKDKGKKPSKADATALRALHEAISEIGALPPASNHIPANTKVATFDQWRTYAYRMGISTGEQRAKEIAFKHASERLIGAARVAVWDQQAWPTS